MRSIPDTLMGWKSYEEAIAMPTVTRPWALLNVEESGRPKGGEVLRFRTPCACAISMRFPLLEGRKF